LQYCVRRTDKPDRISLIRERAFVESHDRSNGRWLLIWCDDRSSRSSSSSSSDNDDCDDSGCAEYSSKFE